MKDLSDFKNFIGCDVSKSVLDFAIHFKQTDYRQFEHVQVANTPDGFRELLNWLKSHKIKLSQTVIAMEHTGIYSEGLAKWCEKKKITFVHLHPLDVKNYCSRGRNKTDKADSQIIADYVYTMREKLQPSAAEPKAINALRQLYNERRLNVRTRTAYSNLLKTTTDPMVIKRMTKLIEQLSDQIKLIEKDIAQLLNTDTVLRRNYNLLLSIPGIGMINAVMTIIATGNFTRFQTSRQYAKFCCVSPMTKQSGSSIHGGDHVLKAGHSEIKSVLTEAARSAIIHDAQLRTYYTRKRAIGKSHGCVMNAVKFKLICRMFAVIKRQQPYVDTEAYRC